MLHSTLILNGTSIKYALYKQITKSFHTPYKRQLVHVQLTNFKVAIESSISGLVALS